MDSALVDRLVNSVLYEGYLLYPYRQALKNAKRWTFGAVYPAASEAARSGAERSKLLARVLVAGDASATIDGEVRFLHLIERTDRQTDAGQRVWHESQERRIEIQPHTIDELARSSAIQPFEFAARRWHEADAVRRQCALRGAAELNVETLGDGIHLLRVSIANESCLEPDAGVLQAFASAHLILRVGGGEFVSRIDPPEHYAGLCTSDPADGLWPVLIGSPPARDAMLCSPIILYDYPELAPESPGDFFDATEIDEMLALRVLTLSDDEKREVAALDERGRALLDRTHELAQRQLARLHGRARVLRPSGGPTDGH